MPGRTWRILSDARAARGGVRRRARFAKSPRNPYVPQNSSSFALRLARPDQASRLPAQRLPRPKGANFNLGFTPTNDPGNFTDTQLLAVLQRQNQSILRPQRRQQFVSQRLGLAPFLGRFDQLF